MASKKRRPEKFIKDLVIAGDDGKLYFLTESAWKAHPMPASAFAPTISNALKAGVALAAVPESAGDPKAHSLDAKGKPVHPLAFCYLVSLASLKTQTTFEK
jgi:hypothetical protein